MLGRFRFAALGAMMLLASCSGGGGSAASGRSFTIGTASSATVTMGADDAA